LQHVTIPSAGVLPKIHPLLVPQVIHKHAVTKAAPASATPVAQTPGNRGLKIVAPVNSKTSKKAGKPLKAQPVKGKAKVAAIVKKLGLKGKGPAPKTGRVRNAFY